FHDLFDPRDARCFLGNDGLAECKQREWQGAVGVDGHWFLALTESFRSRDYNEEPVATQSPHSRWLAATGLCRAPRGRARRGRGALLSAVLYVDVDADASHASVACFVARQLEAPKQILR